MSQLYFSCRNFPTRSFIFSQDSFMLAPCARGTGGDLFPLCRSAVFKLFEESIKNRHISIVLLSNSLYNTANIITKYHILFLSKKLFEFILVIQKETYFTILVQKVPGFLLEPKTSACFFDKFKCRTGSLVLLVLINGDQNRNNFLQCRITMKIVPFLLSVILIRIGAFMVKSQIFRSLWYRQLFTIWFRPY